MTNLTIGQVRCFLGCLLALAMRPTTAAAQFAANPNRFGASNAGIELVDAHGYRHCHNIHTRTYCHKRDRLPMNWPPLSDTPHSGSERPTEPPSIKD